MLYNIPHFIQGKLVHLPGRKLDVYHPRVGEVAGELMVADQALVNNVVQVATEAFQSWSTTTPTHRAKILVQYKINLEANRDELANIVTSEHGKTHEEALGSIQRGIDVLDYACGIANHLKGQFSANVAKDMDTYSMRQPIGVCVGVTPFNFPGMVPLWMFSMAIACGNTFVLKPSEKDPSCAIKLAALAHEAGLPAGVLNVLQGDKETVDALITHDDVDTVSFVGSSPVAEHVYKTAISHNKRAQAFGGAKNHCIVMPDADLDQAAEAIVMAAYGSAGERCMALSVVVAIGDKVADALIQRMLPKIKSFVMSPLITKEHYDRVKAYVELGKKEGATLCFDGDSVSSASRSGFLMEPYLFDNVKPAMKLYQDEIFGPVLSVVRANNFDEALNLINEHQYGNGTVIFTRDGYTARKFAECVQVGMVGINVPIPVPVAHHSFGGWKHSVFSDIGMYGEEAIRFYTKLKTVTARWIKES